MDRYTVRREVVGIVAVPEHEKRRGYETACNYDMLTIPAQVAAIEVTWDSYGASWCSVKLDAFLTEHYYMSSLSSSIFSPGGGAWATSVDHQKGLNKPDRAYYSQPGSGMLDYFIGTLERRGWPLMRV